MFVSSTGGKVPVTDQGQQEEQELNLDLVGFTGLRTFILSCECYDVGSSYCIDSNRVRWNLRFLQISWISGTCVSTEVGTGLSANCSALPDGFSLQR